MSPAILEGAAIATVIDTTEDVKKTQEVQQEPINVLDVLNEEERVSPELLATLFLVLGIVVFVAVMMKRLTSRPEVIHCSGHMKPTMYTYGSIVYPLDNLYKLDIERQAFFKSHIVCSAKTRPTRFISVSEMWKELQTKNNRKINRIPEEPEDTESHYRIAFLS